MTKNTPRIFISLLLMLQRAFWNITSTVWT